MISKWNSDPLGQTLEEALESLLPSKISKPAHELIWIQVMNSYVWNKKVQSIFWEVVFPGVSEVKASASNAGDSGSIPGSWRSPVEGKWQPTPVFLPEESHGRRSLLGCSPQGRKELDTTEQLHFHFSLSVIAHLVKNLPAMVETLVQFLDWEDPLERG